MLDVSSPGESAMLVHFECICACPLNLPRFRYQLIRASSVVKSQSTRKPKRALRPIAGSRRFSVLSGLDFLIDGLLDCLNVSLIDQKT